MKFFSINGLLSFMMVLLVACEKDNYEPPTSFITGKIVYQNNALQVRNARIQLELWQTGFKPATKIPVFANQNGVFSANVFDGNYKLVLLRGVGPWVPNSDTLTINLSGNADVQVPVTPYFVINNPQITKSGSTVNATCNIQQVTATANIEYMALYLSTTQIVDNINQSAVIQKAAAALGPLSSSQTISITIPAALTSREYFFARIGVKTVGVEELIFSPVQKIQ